MRAVEFHIIIQALEIIIDSVDDVFVEAYIMKFPLKKGSTFFLSKFLPFLSIIIIIFR